MPRQIIPVLPICVDEYLPGERFDKTQLPSPVDPRSTSRDELALAKYKLWEPGQILRIRFLDGDKDLHKRVEAHARKWLEHANLLFEFGNYSNAVIRITFIGSGYQSLVGTDATKRPDPEPTMTLGGFTAHTDDLEMQQVVLHEFGHALGCVHEQANPTINILWNKKKVYAYYKYHYEWDKAKVDWNVLKRYSKSEVHSTQHDPQSIMQYPVPKELTTGNFEIGWNNTLSEIDTIFIKAMYPPQRSASTEVQLGFHRRGEVTGILPIQLPDSESDFELASPSVGTTPRRPITPRCDNPPLATELSVWEQQYFSLDTTLAAKLGFPFGTVSGSGRERVIVLEFSRSAPCDANDGTELRYGVAVRLAVKVSNYEASTSLTLPIVAAEAQLGRVEAQSSLLVRGYVGAKLGPLIPPLETFSVESYVNLMQKVSQIQALISQDTDNIRPTLLHVPPEERPKGDQHDHALGVTWALSMLADGASHQRARSAFPWQNAAAALAAIDTTYAEAPENISIGNVEPTKAAREWALNLIGDYRLRKPFLR